MLLPTLVKPENAPAPFLGASVQHSLAPVELSHPCREVPSLLTAPG